MWDNMISHERKGSGAPSASGCLEWLATAPFGVIGSAMGLVSRTESPVPTTEADCAILSRISHGDPGAFDELLELHGPAVFGFLRRRVRVRETAEDLFQETWVRVIHHAGTFRGTASARPWLYRIALNAVTDHFRHETAARRGGGAEHTQLEEATDVATAPDVALLVSEQNTALHRAVEQLPDPYREVVRLRYFEELSTDEVAQVLECAAGTVKSRLSRGLEMLQRELEELR